VKEITQDKKMLEQQLVNKLRNMMFKSFTHEIKTPLNGVIQSMDLTQSLLMNVKHKRKMKDQQSKEFDNILILMSQMSSGVYILQNNLNDLIDYQQIESGNLKVNMRPFNLRECYDHILAIVKP
jgi:two-component system capsular synthesis sensor histidine kinase RcsC